MLAEGHCLRDQALSVCGKAGEAPAHRLGNLQATSLETLRQMVAAGYGCTLLPALALHGRRIRRSPVDAKPIASASRRIAIVYRRSFPRGACLEQLAIFIRGCLPEAVRPLS